MNKSETINNININIKEITKQDKEIFEKNGFLIIDNLLPNGEQVDKLLEKAKSCFHYQGDKGVAPDEVTWRPKLSHNDTTRELCNAWKVDSQMATLILNQEIAKLACELLECDSVRICQDDIFWKPVSAKSIGMHQDLPYFECISSKKVVTLWIALTDVSKENGTLEFATGSHKWKELENSSNSNEEFHAPINYKKSLESVASINGYNSINDIDIHYVTVKKGGASIHHGKLWHGSNSNPSSAKERVSIAIHYIPGDSEFDPLVKPTFSFGRYKLFGSNKLEESFYPITYSKNGYRSPIINQATTN